MKIAFFFRGRPEMAKLIPAELNHVKIFAPEDNVYSAEQLQAVADVDALYTSGAYITAQVFAAARKLRMVQTAGTGFDRVDLTAATKNGVLCCNNAGMNSSRVADFSMMLVLTQLRRYIPTAERMKNGDWEKARAAGVQAVEVEGKTLGIIGFGDIGSKLGKRAHAFDMKVIYNDIRRDANLETAQKIGARWVEKDELYRTADVLSINTPLNETTRGLIDEQIIATMKDGAYIVCTARGNIIDEKALRSALDSGKIAGAAIDVFSAEPIKADNPLLGAKNIALSPHVAGRGKEGVQRSFNVAVENIRRFIEKGEPPINIINHEAEKTGLKTH